MWIKTQNGRLFNIRHITEFEPPTLCKDVGYTIHMTKTSSGISIVSVAYTGNEEECNRRYDALAIAISRGDNLFDFSRPVYPSRVEVGREILAELGVVIQKEKINEH